MKKAIIFIICFVLVFAGVPVTGAKAAYNTVLETIGTRSEIILLASLDNGSVIFSKNAGTRVQPASLTKIMTAALVLEKCENLDEIVTVPTYTIRMFDNTDSSNANLKPGEQISVLNLLYCMLVQSANEAAAILADYVSGGIEEFVSLMNARAKQLGCNDTHFINPHGLDEDGQYTTANDILKLAKHALTFPVFETVTETQKYTVPKTNLSEERELTNTNSLMNKGIRDYYFEYAKGIKTGTTSGAGRCVVSKAVKDGYSYLAVVMRAPLTDIDGDGVDENCAFTDCKAVFQWTFENIKLQPVANPNQIIAEVPVRLSWSVDHVKLSPKEEVLALVPAGIDAGGVLVETVENSLPKSVDAPVVKGQVLGKAKVLYAGEEIARVDLVAADAVSRSVVFYAVSLVKKALNTFLFKLFAAIIAAVVAAYAGLVFTVNLKRRKKRKLKVLNYRDIKK